MGRFGQWNAVGEFAVESVVSEVEVAQGAGDFTHLAGAAVGFDVVAEVGDLVAVRQGLVVGGLAGLEGGDAVLFQAGEFVRLADAVLVEVAPDAQLLPVFVLGVDEAVMVGVFLGEGVKAVSGGAAVGQRGGFAKEFAPGVDDAVAV